MRHYRIMGNILYFLCYNTPVGRRIDGSFIMRNGKQTLDFAKFDKDFACKVCNQMLEMYGPKAHWIKDETGEIIFPVT